MRVARRITAGIVVALSASVLAVPALGETVATQPIDQACAGAPAGRFADVSGPHEPAIDCLGWWGVTQGAGDGLYRPAAQVSRAQMASFVAATLRLSGGTLPASPPRAFSDTAGNVHATAIDQLAALGVVGGVGGGRYHPTGTVTRGQMASFLARAWEARTGAALPVAGAPFPDIEGDVHADNIRRITPLGLTGGTDDGRYLPGATVTRAQMGTFLARLLAAFIGGGHTTYPPANPVPLTGEANDGGSDPAGVVQLATLPGNRGLPGEAGSTGFYWGPGGFPEIGQSVTVEDGFTLTAVEFGSPRISVLPGWPTATEQERSFGHGTVWEGTVEDVAVTLNIWTGPASALGETVQLSDLRKVTSQTMTVDIPIAAPGGPDYEASARLTLPTPVDLAPGSYLVSFAVLVPDPDVMTVYFWGRQIGINDLGGQQHDIPGQCDYPRAPDGYTAGRAYARQSDGEPPYTPEEVGDTFRAHTAKVMAYDPECTDGRQEVFNPGDLDLELLGRS